DTIEVPMLNRTELRDILELLAKMHNRATGLQTIFAGRYSMKSKVAAFADFENVAETVAIAPFTDGEAGDYLRKAGITDAAIVSAVIRKSQLPVTPQDDEDEPETKSEGALPIMLMLHADLINTSKPPLTAEKILESPDLGIVHLIDRVVAQIQNPQLHWVVRYGAIPRRLTKSFLHGVMAPLLPAPMAGPVEYE